METSEHALKNGRSVKAGKRKLGIGKNQMYALSDKKGNGTTNMDKIVKVAEEFKETYTVVGITRTRMEEVEVQRN